MPNKAIGNIARGVGVIATAGLLLYNSLVAIPQVNSLVNDVLSGNKYISLPFSSINLVEVKEAEGREPVDYSQLTWQEAMEYVRTPEEAQDYLNRHLRKKVSVRADSFAVNHADRHGDCNDYAIAAAALLSDNGFTPNLLIVVYEETSSAHAVYVYKTDSGYGALGNKPIKPVFPSIDSLIMRMEIKRGLKIDRYQLVDLNATFPGNQWINGTRNLELPYGDFSDFTESE